MALRLSESIIRARIIEWRNLKVLHQKARERVEIVEGKNQELAAQNKELQNKLRKLQEELRKRDETVEKLQKLLFERQRPRTRTHRQRQPKQRSKESYRRPFPDHVDEQKTASPRECPGCHGPLSDEQSSRTRFIEDIILNPQTIVVEWTITRHWCANCNTLVEAPVPGVLPRAQIGPNALTMVVILRYRFNMPYGKIRDLLKVSYGLSICEGEVAHLLAEVQKLTGEKWTFITQAIKDGKRVHCDETGWYVDGEKVWAHVFSSEQATLYVVHDTRGKGVAQSALGEDFSGTRITDCLANYKNLPGLHQICWAHLTREAQENAEREVENKERQRLSKALDTIYARLRAQTDTWEEKKAQEARRRCEKEIDHLLEESWHDPPSRKLVNRLKEFRHALFVCLTVPNVPPDNNEAERSLRKLVVQRKIWGGNRSWKHASIHAQMMSIIETLRKEGTDTLSGLQALINAGIAKELSFQ